MPLLGWLDETNDQGTETKKNETRRYVEDGLTTLAFFASVACVFEP
jgi:hypothetical protein